MQVQRTIEKRARDWGSKGDKGNASQVVPLVPLEEKSKAENHK